MNRTEPPHQAAPERRRYCDRLKKVAITRSFLERLFGPSLSQMKPDEGRKLINSILEKLQQPEEVFQK